MYKLSMLILLSLMVSVSASASQSAPTTNNDKLILIGAGVLGVVLASGATGVLSSVSMMSQGAGFAEAMEAGANLSLPVTFLSAILGSMFLEDWVRRGVAAFKSDEAQHLAHGRSATH